jgi:hypothetical protein
MPAAASLAPAPGVTCAASDHFTSVPAVAVFTDRGPLCETCADLVNAWFSEGSILLFQTGATFSQNRPIASRAQRDALRAALVAAEDRKPFEVRAIRAFCNALVADGDPIWAGHVTTALRILR